MIKQNALYEIKIGEDIESYVSAIALVEDSAIEKDFMAFDKHRNTNTKLTFKIDSSERMELIGCAMIPDILIPRVTDEGQWYDVVFSAEDIRTASQLFFKQQNNFNLNLNHIEDDIASDCFIYQSYIVDRERGLMPPLGMEELPDGSWIIGVKIDNIELWNSIKEGKFRGFSVEGLFTMLEKVSGTQEALEHLKEDVKGKMEDWLDDLELQSQKQELKREIEKLQNKIISDIVN